MPRRRSRARRKPDKADTKPRTRRRTALGFRAKQMATPKNLVTNEPNNRANQRQRSRKPAAKSARPHSTDRPTDTHRDNRERTYLADERLQRLLELAGAAEVGACAGCDGFRDGSPCGSRRAVSATARACPLLQTRPHPPPRPRAAANAAVSVPRNLQSVSSWRTFPKFGSFSGFQRHTPSPWRARHCSSGFSTSLRK